MKSRKIVSYVREIPIQIIILISAVHKSSEILTVLIVCHGKCKTELPFMTVKMQSVLLTRTFERYDDSAVFKTFCLMNGRAYYSDRVYPRIVIQR